MRETTSGSAERAGAAQPVELESPPTSRSLLYLDTSDLRTCRTDPEAHGRVLDWLRATNSTLAISPVHLLEWARSRDGIGAAVKDLRWHVEHWPEVFLLPPVATMVESQFLAAARGTLTYSYQATLVSPEHDLEAVVTYCIAPLKEHVDAPYLSVLMDIACVQVGLGPTHSFGDFAKLQPERDDLERLSAAPNTAETHREQLKQMFRRDHHSFENLVKEIVRLTSARLRMHPVRRFVLVRTEGVLLRAFLYAFGRVVGNVGTHDLVRYAPGFFWQHWRSTRQTPAAFLEANRLWRYLPVGLVYSVRACRGRDRERRPQFGDMPDDLHLLYFNPAHMRMTVDKRTLDWVTNVLRPYQTDWVKAGRLVRSGLLATDWVTLGDNGGE